MMRYGFDSGFSHMGLFGGVFMMLIGLAILGLLIYVVIALARNTKHIGNGTTFRGTAGVFDPASALGILSERYARGEIDHDEYVKRKSELLKP